MAWDKGFAFAGSNARAAEMAAFNATHVTPDDLWISPGPSNRNGVIFGWMDSTNGADRTGSGDPRLGGIIYTITNVRDFRVTLEAPDQYDIFIAQGDFTQANPDLRCRILDGASVLWTIGTNQPTGANKFFDANNTERTAVQWVADSAMGGVAKRLTFASTEFYLRLDPPTANPNVIAYLGISRVVGGGGGGSNLPLLMNAYRQRRS